MSALCLSVAAVPMQFHRVWLPGNTVPCVRFLICCVCVCVFRILVPVSSLRTGGRGLVFLCLSHCVLLFIRTCVRVLFAADPQTFKVFSHCAHCITHPISFDELSQLMVDGVISSQVHYPAC